jgi:hypothetical protein
LILSSPINRPPHFYSDEEAIDQVMLASSAVERFNISLRPYVSVKNISRNQPATIAFLSKA